MTAHAWTLAPAQGAPDANGFRRAWTEADAGRLARQGVIATDRGPIRVGAHVALVVGDLCHRCGAAKVVSKAGGRW